MLNLDEFEKLLIASGYYIDKSNGAFYRICLSSQSGATKAIISKKHKHNFSIYDEMDKNLILYISEFSAIEPSERDYDIL